MQRGVTVSNYGEYHSPMKYQLAFLILPYCFIC